MRQPLTPDYASLEEEVTGDDCFLLQAVLQHGGLTLQEAARVLGLDPAEAERRVVRLLELQVLEPEPTCPGFRVLPEAGRFVRTVLHRHNLV
jgi:DNA-binding IclR family transcriptional regulator